MSVEPMPTMEAIARQLATWHQQGDSALVAIYWYPHEQYVQLVEVTDGLRRNDEEPLLFPFGFAATRQVPYPSVVILASRAEWEQVRIKPELLPESFQKVAPVQVYPAP